VLRFAAEQEGMPIADHYGTNGMLGNRSQQK
jgi:hypothetical protein